ncbi:MAG: outer membrane beta-barrel domain-containing protein [Bdellovibrio sp.]|nr:MAG: outer membrane beta-barrel domain-containing protein [Bdellovibrio sp.]
MGSSVGLNMTEALYNNIFWNLNASYHFTEVHGINVVANMMLPGLSKNGQALKDGKIQKSNLTFDPSRAPSSTYSLFGNYQLVAYYGKISLTKQLVMNLSLYGLAGLGVVSFGDSTSIGMDVGFGQKLYFTKNLALRFDMSVYVYPGPDPTAPKTPNKLLLTGGEKLGSSDFEQTVYSHVFLSFGLVYLL